MNYPREVGTATQVAEKDWNHDAPFGHCPACGSLAMEDCQDSRTPDINFYCSDTSCKTDKGRRTMWGSMKTAEVVQWEADGSTWNLEMFPNQELPEFCPD